MRSRLLPVLAITFLAAPAFAGSRTEQKSLPLKAGGSLSVTTRNSPIRVEGWDKDEVAVTARIEDSDARPVRWEMTAQNGCVVVEAIFPKPSAGFHVGRGPSCAFTVMVPRKVEAEFATSNDAIAAGGFGGTLSFRTSNDKVELENLDGAVSVTTSNAAITAKHLKASLKGRTSNDTIRLEDVRGGVDLTTTNADVVASGLDGWNQGIALATSNGDLDITLGSATGEVTARTSRHESVRVERHQVDLLGNDDGATRFRVPGSSQAITLTTTNGTITVR